MNSRDLCESVACIDLIHRCPLILVSSQVQVQVHPFLAPCQRVDTVAYVPRWSVGLFGVISTPLDQVDFLNAI